MRERRVVKTVCALISLCVRKKFKAPTERYIAKAVLVALVALAEIPATTTTAAPITKLKHAKRIVNPITTKHSEKLNTKSTMF